MWITHILGDKLEVKRTMPQDKVYHFIGGALLCIATGLVTGQPAAGIVAAIVVGIAKEVYDKVSRRGTPELLDAAATAAGGALGYLLFM